MSYLTPEKILEKESRDEFKRLLSPWTITVPEDDTGIDLYIQPLNDNGQPDKSFFMAQLKSTNESVPTNPKESISMEHLKQWNESTIPTMLVKYYKNDNTTYYTWIDKSIKLALNQKYQTIYFNQKLTKNSKEDILNYLEPLEFKIQSIDYATPEQPYIMGKTNSVKIRNRKHFENGFPKALNKLDEQARKYLPLHNQLQKLDLLFIKTRDLKLLIPKSFILAKLGKFNDANRELCNLLHSFKMPIALVLQNLIKNNKDILDKLNELKIIYYLKWSQITPPKTDITCKVTVDGKEIVLKPYNPKGNVLPEKIKELKNMSFQLHSFDGTDTPSLQLNTIKLYVTFLDENGNPLYEIGEEFKQINNYSL